ncbi:MAG: hypothetical protein U5R14_01325 [Gemmatimonadota bacterium]|nr:hypothetical protein [Gemmatimonadota bacterium]
MTKLIARGLLRTLPGRTLLLTVALGSASFVTETRAQAIDLDFAVEQALTSVDDMASPTGYRAGLTLPWMLGPVGLELGYRSVSEYLGERPERCGMDVCTPGPFDAVMRMRSAALGVSVSRMLNPFVEFSVGGTATLTWHDSEYGPADGATEAVTPSTETAGPDPGVGAFVSWRFPPLVSVLRPFLYARAEWIGRGSCAADALCFGTRYFGSAGIGMYARFP